jgi:hypothetical protein
MTWAMLAVGAVAYLAILAFPQPVAPPPQAADADPAKGEPTAAKALAEVRSVRGSLSEVRKDVTDLQDAMGERVANEKGVQSRLTTLEERVAVIEPGKSPPEPGSKLPDKSAQLEPRTTADILARTRADPAVAPPPKAETHPPAPAPAAPIETGSITSKAAAAATASDAPKAANTSETPKAAKAPPKTPKTAKANIVFGEAVVTRAVQEEFAVQLAAGPSVKMLRKSWGRLVARHGGSLGALKPRVVAPLTEGGPYRLLAGPVPTRADAARICAELGTGPNSCLPTAYGGAPL